MPASYGSFASKDLLISAVGALALVPGADYSAERVGRWLGIPGPEVRRALRSLAAEGVVEELPDGGFRIHDPTVAELRETVELRRLLEVTAVRRTAEAGLSDAALARLRALAHGTLVAAQAHDVIGYINADMEFHVELVQTTGDAQLVEVVRVLRSRSRLRGLPEAQVEAFMLQNAEEHLRLVTLVGAGDATAAAALLDEHIARIARRWPHDDTATLEPD